jgi:O-methyltransferase
VELGCNAGESNLVMRMVLDTLAPEKQLHAYDSFQGLPVLSEADDKDSVYDAGHMSVDLEVLIKNFATLKLKMPHIHEGWFADTVPSELPEQICFALFDGDLYESTKHILPHVYKRMPPGAIGMIAVYYDEMLLPRKGLEGYYRSPGVKRAVDEFFADKPEHVGMLYANENACGYFRKQ